MKIINPNIGERMSFLEGITLTSVFKVATGAAAFAVTTAVFAKAGLPVEGAAIPGLAVGTITYGFSGGICERIQKAKSKKSFYQDNLP